MSITIQYLQFITSENIPASLRGDGPGFCVELKAALSDKRTVSSHVFVSGKVTDSGQLYGMAQAYDAAYSCLQRYGVECERHFVPVEEAEAALSKHLAEQEVAA